MRNCVVPYSRHTYIFFHRASENVTFSCFKVLSRVIFDICLLPTPVVKYSSVMVAGEEFLTRHCLQNLRDYTSHRRAMPTVMRHGYCNAARTGDAYNPWNQNMVYCFCNDWNGCNSAPGLGRHGWSAVVFATMGLLLTRLCL